MAQKSKDTTKDTTKTDAWNEAEFEYLEIIAESMVDTMPFFGLLREIRKPLSKTDRINAMKEILKKCPQFYPAAIDTGQNYLITGNDKEGLKYFDDGLKIVKENFSKKEIMKVYEDITEFLENMERYSEAIKYFKEWVDAEGDIKKKARIYDDMTVGYYRLGKIDEAISAEEKAIEMYPNANKYSNMGWLYMCKGNLDLAEKFLKSALKMDKNFTTAKGNLESCKFMKENKIKDWDAYLLRNVDYEHLEKLKEEDDEKYVKEVKDYNGCRIDAFKTYLARNNAISPHEKRDLFFHANFFLNFIAENDYTDEFLYDDISYVKYKFETMMCKFIAKMSDVDEEIIILNCLALLEFYKFLKEKRLISKEEYSSLRKEINESKEEILDKMNKYNKVRNDPDVTEEEKRNAREKILGIYY